VALGEVGLAGEVRPVRHLVERLREAARLGLRHALVPTGSTGLDQLDADLQVTVVPDVAAAVSCLTPAGPTAA
jgi:DNA repair protein RadA/Sms